MKITININFQGQLITIEETAYNLLNKYIESLKEYFGRDAEGAEIVNDIESRIAELFGNRLKHGIACITDEDVTSVIDTIGRVEDFDSDFGAMDNEALVGESAPPLPPPYNKDKETQTPPPFETQDQKRLFRKKNDKILGGVCSGLAHYLKIDPVFIRLAFVFLSSLLFWVYIIMWIILPAKILPDNVSKRLYRSTTDRFIAGVSGGIAAYFKIDTWIPRLIFLLPIIFNIVGIDRFPVILNSSVNISFTIIYIVLWIIVPQAVTVKQKLEMMGEDEYLRSIRATMSDNVAQARSIRADAANASVGASTEHGENKSAKNNSIDNQSHNEALGGASDQYTTPPPPPPHINATHTTYASSQPQRSGCFNFLIGLIKIVFFGIVGIVVASFMVSVFALIFTGTKFLPLQSLFVSSGLEHTLLWISVVLTLLIPFVGLIIWIVRRAMKAKSRPAIGFIVAGLWIVGIMAGLTLGYKITSKFNVESLQETNIELTSPKNNSLHVEMARYPLNYFSVTPETSVFIIGKHRLGGDNFNSLPFYNVEEDSLLFNNIELRIKESNDTLFHVKTIYSSFNRNNKSARANLKEFDFRLEQNDSVLWIPQFFKIPKEQGYRKQAVVIEILVPSGSRLELSEELEDYQYPISRPSEGRGYGRGYRNSFEWQFNEEDMQEEDVLTETNLLKDSL